MTHYLALAISYGLFFLLLLAMGLFAYWRLRSFVVSEENTHSWDKTLAKFEKKYSKNFIPSSSDSKGLTPF